VRIKVQYLPIHSATTVLVQVAKPCIALGACFLFTARLSAGFADNHWLT